MNATKNPPLEEGAGKKQTEELRQEKGCQHSDSESSYQNKKMGWVATYRSIEDHPRYKSDNWFRIWMHILLNASHKEHSAIFNGKKIILKPGQLITGRFKIAEKTGISEHIVYRMLNVLEIEQQIAQQKSTKSTLITVKNWDIYQSNAQQIAQQVHNKCTTRAHYTTMINNENNVLLDSVESNGPKGPIKKKFVIPSLEEVIVQCNAIGLPEDQASSFIDHHQARDWCLPPSFKVKIKDWKAALRTWKKNYHKFNQQAFGQNQQSGYGGTIGKDLENIKRRLLNEKD